MYLIFSSFYTHRHMRTLKGDGCLKALDGTTSLTEVTRVTNL